MDFATGFFTGGIAVIVTGVVLHVTGEADDMTTEEKWLAAGSAFATGFAIGSGMEIPSFGGMIRGEKISSNSTAVLSQSMMRNSFTDPPYKIQLDVVELKATRLPRGYTAAMGKMHGAIARYISSEVARGNYDFEIFRQNGISIDKKTFKLNGTAEEVSEIAFEMLFPTLMFAAEAALFGVNGFTRVSGFYKATKAAKASNLVKIGEISDDVIIFSRKFGDEAVEGIANFKMVGDKLHLNGLHLQGSSAGQIGRSNLWNMAKDLGKQFNAKEVIIQGGKRTTGKYKGTVPSPITIKVN